MSENTKFAQYLQQTDRHVCTKMQQACSENKLTVGERNL